MERGGGGEERSDRLRPHATRAMARRNRRRWTEEESPILYRRGPSSGRDGAVFVSVSSRSHGLWPFEAGAPPHRSDRQQKRYIHVGHKISQITDFVLFLFHRPHIYPERYAPVPRSFLPPSSTPPPHRLTSCPPTTSACYLTAPPGFESHRSTVKASRAEDYWWHTHLEDVYHIV